MPSGYKHGLSHTTEYDVWCHIKARCYYTKDKYYKNYGGRGIVICDRWLDKEDGMINFVKDMGKRPSSKHSIDRLDNNGNYTPENCRWATAEEQANNRTSNTVVNYKGEDISLAEVSRKYNFPYKLLDRRYNKGWSIEKILSTPIRKIRNNLYTFNGKTQNIMDWARELDTYYQTLLHRLKHGWSIESTFTTPIRKRSK